MKLLHESDHALTLSTADDGKVYAHCSCRFWSTAGKEAKVCEEHANHLRSTDRNGLVCCIFCGGEDTAYLHSMNHGGQMGYNRGDGVCMAMYLRRNHVLGISGERVETRVSQLPEYIERAREVWARKGDAWLDEYEALCTPLRVPVPAGVSDSEEVGLW